MAVPLPICPVFLSGLQEYRPPLDNVVQPNVQQFSLPGYTWAKRQRLAVMQNGPSATATWCRLGRCRASQVRTRPASGHLGRPLAWPLPLRAVEGTGLALSRLAEAMPDGVASDQSLLHHALLPGPSTIFPAHGGGVMCPTGPQHRKWPRELPYRWAGPVGLWAGSAGGVGGARETVGRGP